MRNKKNKSVPSLFTRKILEDIKSKKIDFVVDLIIVGFIFYIVYSILTGLGSVIK